MAKRSPSTARAKGAKQKARGTPSHSFDVSSVFDSLLAFLEREAPQGCAAFVWNGRNVEASFGTIPGGLLDAAGALPKMKWLCVAAHRPDAKLPTDEEVEKFVRASRTLASAANPPCVAGDGFFLTLISERHATQRGLDLVAYLRDRVESSDTRSVQEFDKERRRQVELDLAKESLAMRNPAVMGLLRGYTEKVESFRERVREELQVDLDRWNQSAPTFSSAEEKLVFASLLTQLLNRLGLRLKCQRSDCGQPALLRGGRYGTPTEGLFQFQHVVNGKSTTHFASSELPRLELTLEPEPSSRKIRADK